jgi:hypothetical protein
MSSEPIRDPVADHLLTPQNAALLIIDYQPTQVNSIRSMDHGTLLEHIVTVAKTAVACGLPIILSTVNVQTGVNKPTVPPLLDVLRDILVYDRTTINAWEDVEFRKAAEMTGRREARDGRPVDRGVSHISIAGCDARGIRGLSRGGRGRRDLRGSARGRPAACRARRGPAHQHPAAPLRVAAGLGTHAQRTRVRGAALSQDSGVVPESGRVQGPVSVAPPGIRSPIWRLVTGARPRRR